MISTSKNLLSILCLLWASRCCLSFQSVKPSAASTTITAKGATSKAETKSSTSLYVSTTKAPGSAQLDTPWQELGFEYRPTNSHLRMTYKDGKWQEPELVKVKFIMRIKISLCRF